MRRFALLLMAGVAGERSRLRRRHPGELGPAGARLHPHPSELVSARRSRLRLVSRGPRHHRARLRKPDGERFRQRFPRRRRPRLQEPLAARRYDDRLHQHQLQRHDRHARRRDRQSERAHRAVQRLSRSRHLVRADALRRRRCGRLAGQNIRLHQHGRAAFRERPVQHAMEIRLGADERRRDQRHAERRGRRRLPLSQFRRRRHGQRCGRRDDSEKPGRARSPRRHPLEF